MKPRSTHLAGLSFVDVDVLGYALARLHVDLTLADSSPYTRQGLAMRRGRQATIETVEHLQRLLGHRPGPARAEGSLTSVFLERRARASIPLRIAPTPEPTPDERVVDEIISEAMR